MWSTRKASINKNISHHDMPHFQAVNTEKVNRFLQINKILTDPDTTELHDRSQIEQRWCRLCSRTEKKRIFRFTQHVALKSNKSTNIHTHTHLYNHTIPYDKTMQKLWKQQQQQPTAWNIKSLSLTLSIESNCTPRSYAVDKKINSINHAKEIDILLHTTENNPETLIKTASKLARFWLLAQQHYLNIITIPTLKSLTLVTKNAKKRLLVIKNVTYQATKLSEPI